MVVMFDYRLVMVIRFDYQLSQIAESTAQILELLKKFYTRYFIRSRRNKQNNKKLDISLKLFSYTRLIKFNTLSYEIHVENSKLVFVIRFISLLRFEERANKLS